MADFEAKLNMSLDDVIKASKKKVNKDNEGAKKNTPAKTNGNSNNGMLLMYPSSINLYVIHNIFIGTICFLNIDK